MVAKLRKNVSKTAFLYLFARYFYIISINVYISI